MLIWFELFLNSVKIWALGKLAAMKAWMLGKLSALWSKVAFWRK